MHPAPFLHHPHDPVFVARAAVHRCHCLGRLAYQQFKVSSATGVGEVEVELFGGVEEEGGWDQRRGRKSIMRKQIAGEQSTSGAFVDEAALNGRALTLRKWAKKSLRVPPGLH